MDPNQLQINVDSVVNRLANRVGELEREVAILLAQQEALVKKLEESGAGENG